MRTSWILGLLALMTTIAQTLTAADRTVPRDRVESSLAFEPTVESPGNYRCPEWFRDAKFGIYLHWGPYSVAEMGEWYARKLYLEGGKEYEYHLKHYGHPSEFGYKDFVPMWKAENFDPEKLVALFKRAGARYFCPCAAHHDNFDLWNSRHHEWNAVKKGPGKDLIKMWRDAALKQGLRFGVTTHLSRSYSWLNVANGADTKGPHKGIPYDGADPRDRGLYPPRHDDTHQRAPINAPQKWCDLWARRIKDLIDNYHPDHLYFDCAVPFRGDDFGRTGLDVIAYYYNHNMQMHGGRLEGVMCIKERPFQGLYADGITTLDFERGKAGHIRDKPWQTDDSIGSWGYNKDAPYTTADAVIDKFIDIVSKNGNLLLNIPIRADGTLDETATAILEDMGVWLRINGEAIYGTRPWYTFGEGPTHIPHKTIELPCTWKDIRHTVKGDYLYIFVLDWLGHKRDVVFSMLAPTNYRIGKIESVELLGHRGPIQWEQAPDGLTVRFPQERPCDFAYTLKVLLPKK